MTDQDQPPTLATQDDLNELYMAVERKMFLPLVEHCNNLDNHMRRLQEMLQALLDRERARLH